MPSQSPEITQYTTIPLIVFEIGSYARFHPVQSQVLNYLIGKSLNVIMNKKPITARQWVKFHTTDFANERAHTRQGVQEALSMLIDLGMIEARDSVLQTNSGMQKGREFKIASQKELEQILDVLKHSVRPRGANSNLAPRNVEIDEGANSNLAPRQAPVGTSTGPSWHLDRPELAPWGVTLPKSLKNFRHKDSLKTLKYFLNTFSKFDHSFLELYFEKNLSKTEESKLPMQIGALVRRYSLFSVYIAMSVNLFDESAEIGSTKLLRAFLEMNKQKLIDQEQELKLHCNNLFNSILNLDQEIQEKTKLQDLEIFKENFRTSASALLIRKEFEQGSNKIFLYSSFQNDVVEIFRVSNYNLERFTNEIIKKINLYFKFKIFGMKNGLNFVQSEEY